MSKFIGDLSFLFIFLSSVDKSCIETDLFSILLRESQGLNSYLKSVIRLADILQCPKYRALFFISSKLGNPSNTLELLITCTLKASDLSENGLFSEVMFLYTSRNCLLSQFVFNSSIIILVPVEFINSTGISFSVNSIIKSSIFCAELS